MTKKGPTKTSPPPSPPAPSEKKWFVVWGVQYFGPYNTDGEAKVVRRTKKPDGVVELLNPTAKTPTFGLHGPLKPRYP